LLVDLRVFSPTGPGSAVEQLGKGLLLLPRTDAMVVTPLGGSPTSSSAMPSGSRNCFTVQVSQRVASTLELSCLDVKETSRPQVSRSVWIPSIASPVWSLHTAMSRVVPEVICTSGCCPFPSSTKAVAAAGSVSTGLLRIHPSGITPRLRTDLPTELRLFQGMVAFLGRGKPRFPSQELRAAEDWRAGGRRRR